MAKSKTRQTFNQIRPIDLGTQGYHIRYRFPSFSYRRRNGRGVWIGTLQPQQTSPTYQVEIEYRHRKPPAVKVIWPSIVAGAPHLYPDGSLCLYWPKERRWQSDQLLAETIIPWTALWLYYYELWLDTDKWLGPSSHDPFPEIDKLR